MAPIGVRYYNCRNAGIGIIIWPQLRSGSDSKKITWDGRDHGGYKLYINSAVTVDLKNTNLAPSDQFFLAENTMFGIDMYDLSQAFFYDPNSHITACATKWGGVDDGSLTYGGCKSDTLEGMTGMDEISLAFPLANEFNAYAAAVADEALREFLLIAFQSNGSNFTLPWKAIAKWATGTNPTFVVSGIFAITAFLIQKGYAVEKVIVTLPDGSKVVTFKFGPQHHGNPPNDSVPQKIKDDWKGALTAAKQWKPIDGGVYPNR